MVVHVQSARADAVIRAEVEVELRGEHGYLSVADWPLLPFYGCMCGAYLAMGIVWLVLCARHWRDLLRIQVGNFFCRNLCKRGGEIRKKSFKIKNS